MSHSKEIRRERFAALVAEGALISVAAAAVGISVNTATAWLAHPDVIAFLDEQRAALRAGTSEQLLRFASSALTRAEELLASPDTPPGVIARLTALALMEMRAWVEIADLTERIEMLEKARAV